MVVDRKVGARKPLEPLEFKQIPCGLCVFVVSATTPEHANVGFRDHHQWHRDAKETEHS